MKSVLDNITIVLVGTLFPGNIGSVARAMKNMGMQRLCLVSPQCSVNEESFRMATSAGNILRAAVYAGTLRDAIADAGYIFGTTARTRRWRPHIFPPQMGKKAAELLPNNKVALVFGPEGTGLSEADTDLCDLVITIPTAPAHRVLNLSHAVCTCAYQLFLDSCRDRKAKDEIEYRRASEHKLAMLEALFADALKSSPTVRDKKKVSKAFQRLVKRSLPSEEEVSTLLCAIDSFNSAEKYRSQKGKS